MPIRTFKILLWCLLLEVTLTDGVIASKSVALGSEIGLTPVDTDVKMDVHKMFRMRPGRLLNVYQGRLEVQRGIYNFSN